MAGVKYTLKDLGGGSFHIEGEPECGVPMGGAVGFIHEMESENPVLDLRSDLGIDGVKEIVRLVEQYKSAKTAIEEPCPKCRSEGRVMIYGKVGTATPTDGGTHLEPTGAIVQWRCPECGERWEQHYGDTPTTKRKE